MHKANIARPPPVWEFPNLKVGCALLGVSRARYENLPKHVWTERSHEDEFEHIIYICGMNNVIGILVHKVGNIP